MSARHPAIGMSIATGEPASAEGVVRRVMADKVSDLYDTMLPTDKIWVSASDAYRQDRAKNRT